MFGVQARRLWLNVTLLLLVAGLGGVAWWWKQADEARQVSGLLPLTVAEVVQLEIDRNPADPGKDMLAFQKLADSWQMTAPQEVAADPVRVRQLLTLLEEPVAASYSAEGKDLAQFGLEPGEVLVSFNQQQLVLGMENPVSGRRYILHGGQIKLVAESVFGSLTGDWAGFVAEEPAAGKANGQ